MKTHCLEFAPSEYYHEYGFLEIRFLFLSELYDICQLMGLVLRNMH